MTVPTSERVIWIGEVRMQGPGFDCRNNIAVGVSWAAKRIAVAHLNASAGGEVRQPDRSSLR